MRLINGGVYKRSVWRFVLIYFCIDEGKYGMLHLSRSMIDGMTCTMFQGDKEGKYLFTELELKEQWDSDTWVLLDGRLRIEKIDPEMRLVDYTIGELEPYKI